ncbi:MAG: tetratricopeptide repeat protein [Methylococcaceae bacterium]|jgi:TPR repeat protein
MPEQNTFSITELQQKANDGDAQAQFDLALCYTNGTPVEKNEELAFKWHNKTAEQGHVNAQFALGLLYLMGKGEQETKPLIEKWAKDKFVVKIVDPALDLAVSQALSKTLTSANHDLAFLWLKKAAEQNHAGANYWLGVCYQDGIGTQQNDELAFESFKIAAEQGYPEAYYSLAVYYLDGKGVKQSNARAFELYRHSAPHQVKNPLKCVHQ